MRVVVLGGAGDMGSETVRDLVGFTDVGQVTIADMNIAAAQRLASSLGGRRDVRVVVERLDAASRQDLVRVMKGHDVAAGALGPFYRFERPIVEAAIEAGVDYVSICDDHDAAEAVLGIDQEAAEKGRKILTGLGLSPGVTNILARKGYDELENTESVRAYWAGSSGDAEGLAVIMHVIHIFTGKVTSFQNGGYGLVKAGSGREVVEFPAPMNKVNTYHVGHPEPVTLPRYLKGLREVTLKGGLAENYLNVLAKTAAALRLTSTASRKQRLGVILKKVLPFFPPDRNRSFMGARVDITGERGGKRVRVTYLLVDHMRRLTGIPLSIGACWMGQGRIGRFGVYGPEAEGALDADGFLKELARRNIVVQRRETGLP